MKQDDDFVRRGLESDEMMYACAIQDLIENGGEEQAIKKLEERLSGIRQALNLIPVGNEKKSYFC